MIRILLVSLIFANAAFAQTNPRTVKRPPLRRTVKSSNIVNLGTPAAPLATPTAAPTPAALTLAPPPSPWKLSYFGEYQGPSLAHIAIGRTQTPGQPVGYTEWDHSLKGAYAVSKNVTIGTQFRAVSPTDPTSSFGFADQRFYSQWSHMIETSDLDMAGKLTFELPTTSASRNKGKIIAFKLEENVIFKTALRNWSFSADFLVKPTFFNDPVAGGAGRSDLNFGVFPYVTLDLFPNLQLLFEGSFDAAHNYTAATYDYLPGDPDFIDIGPLITINSHINTNVALRFFTGDFSPSAAAIYLNIGAAL